MNPIIEVQNLTRAYPMGGGVVLALRGITLTIPRGSFVAITGPSGSGKSTLMTMLGCLDTPSAGSYQLDGVAIEHLNADGLAAVRRHKIGFIFQQFHLLPRLSALENVELALVYQGWPAGAERRERAIAALEMVGLGDRLRHRPNALSGGQQQRVAIARALVRSPALLLADEPTGNLDSQATGELLALFERLHAAGHTLVVVTHELEVALRAERMLTIRDGLLVEDRPVSREASRAGA